MQKHLTLVICRRIDKKHFVNDNPEIAKNSKTFFVIQIYFEFVPVDAIAKLMINIIHNSFRSSMFPRINDYVTPTNNSIPKHIYLYQMYWQNRDDSI